MGTKITSAVAAALLLGGSLTAIQPAEAHDRTGVAVVAGLVGLGIGAAIVSGHSHPTRVQYDEAPFPPPPPSYGYDAPPPEQGYYAPPPPPPGYGYGYSRSSNYGYGYGQTCRVTRRWDSYLGAYVKHRRCW